jgi:hypothetical protein
MESPSIFLRARLTAGAGRSQPLGGILSSWNADAWLFD